MFDRQDASDLIEAYQLSLLGSRFLQVLPKKILMHVCKPITKANICFTTEDEWLILSD